MIWFIFPLSILLIILPHPTLGDQEAVLVQSHQISPSFWSDGVDNSKRILEKILRKIRSYEEDISKTLNIHKELALKLTNKLMQDKNGQMWVDEGRNVKLVLDKDSQCYEIQNLENLIPNIGYTCEEVDQLHGIGYHHVYEQCDDPIGQVFFSNFTVDYQVCLSGFYPWIDTAQYSVCIMKSYKHNFLACFCSMTAGKPNKRSFCITKFECLFGGKGVSEQQGLELSETCFKKMHYFIEINHHTANWVRMAQVSDKLRVRAPYHQESPCFQQQFEADFDIGQIDVNNLEAGILSLTTLTEEGLSKFTQTVSTCPSGANLGINEHLMENVIDTSNENNDQCYSDDKCFTENDDIINSRTQIEKIIEKRSAKQSTSQAMEDTFCSSENLFQKDETTPKLTLPAGVTINEEFQEPDTTEIEPNDNGQGKAFIDEENENECGTNSDKFIYDVNNDCYVLRQKKNLRGINRDKMLMDFYTLTSGIPFLYMKLYSTGAIGKSTKLYYFRETSRMLPIVTGTFWFFNYWVPKMNPRKNPSTYWIFNGSLTSPDWHFGIQDCIGICLMCYMSHVYGYYNYDEYAIFAMRVSGICLFVDIPIYYMTLLIKYQGDVIFLLIAFFLYWAGFGFYVFQNLWKITKRISEASLDMEKKKCKKRLGRSIQRDDKSTDVKTSSTENLNERCDEITKEANVAEVSMESVSCQANCKNVSNLGKVSINCTARCYLKYHQQCWKMEMDSLNIKNERSSLHMDCFTSDCWGKIKEIISYDAHGAELPRKISMTANEILKSKQKHTKSRKGQEDIKSKLNKGEKAKRKDSEIDDQEQRKSIPENFNGKRNCVSKVQMNKMSTDSYVLDNSKMLSDENSQSGSSKSGTVEKLDNSRILKKSISVSPSAPPEEFSTETKMRKKKQKLKKTMSLVEFRAEVVVTGTEIKDYPVDQQHINWASKQSVHQVCISSTSLPPSQPRYSSPPPLPQTKVSGKTIALPSKLSTPAVSRYSTPSPSTPTKIAEKNTLFPLPPSTLSSHFSEPTSIPSNSDLDKKPVLSFINQIFSPPSSICSMIQDAGGEILAPTNSKGCLKDSNESFALQSVDSASATPLLPLSTATQQITLSPFISPLQTNYAPEMHAPLYLPFSQPVSSMPITLLPFPSQRDGTDFQISTPFSPNIPKISDHLLNRSDPQEFFYFPASLGSDLISQPEDTLSSNDNSIMIDGNNGQPEHIRATGHCLLIGNERNQNKNIEKEKCVRSTSTIEFVPSSQSPNFPNSQSKHNWPEDITGALIYCHGKNSQPKADSEKETIFMSNNTSKVLQEQQFLEIRTATQHSPKENTENENRNESILPPSHPSMASGDKNTSPLTKIVAKKFPHVSISDIYLCLDRVLNSYDVANTTLPEFINLISQQVENVLDSWKDEIYMSDEDESITEPSDDQDDVINAILEDMDECAICTELLEAQLEKMDPCGHIFHTECIRSWAKKEATCPQCRANIQLSP